MIPTPSREVALDLRLILTLAGLSSAMLASWLRSRFPAAERWLPAGWYGVVLAVVTAASYAAVGLAPRVSMGHVSLVLSAGMGIVLGGIAVAVEMGVNLSLARRMGRQRGAGGPGTRSAEGRGVRPPVATMRGDVAVGDDVVWRLRERGPWSNGRAALLFIAVFEELLYRQALLVLLSGALGGAILPALVSTLCFGLIHAYFGLPGVLSKWLLGGIMSAVVIAGGGLAAAIVAHCVLNSVAYALTGSRR